MKKRKHHIIPVTYLSGFVDNNGKIFQFLKDSPDNSQYNFPRELGYRRDYYSQPLPDGETDFNKMEDAFSEFESLWPNLVKKIVQQLRLNKNDIVSLFTFLTMMKVRVPATRDSIEQMLVHWVKTYGDILEKQGELPPRPPELEGIELEVSIDPHQSILAMIDVAKGFNNILNSINFVIFHNNTSIPLLTSDNPIVFFDPSKHEKTMPPYTDNLESIEFIFPINSEYVLHGHSGYDNMSFPYEKITEEKVIRRFNRLICKFGYERIFASSKIHSPLILKHSKMSPIMKLESCQIGTGRLLIRKHEFGFRTKLPKWVAK